MTNEQYATLLSYLTVNARMSLQILYALFKSSELEIYKDAVEEMASYLKKCIDDNKGE